MSMRASSTAEYWDVFVQVAVPAVRESVIAAERSATWPAMATVASVSRAAMIAMRNFMLRFPFVRSLLALPAPPMGATQSSPWGDAGVALSS
jgi:hypothetical protein